MKVIVFDFDGTLTKKSHELWEKMWSIIDASDIDYMLYTKHKNGELEYVNWCKEVEKEYIKRGFNEELLAKASNGIELMDNLEETLKILTNNGYKLFIVSGGVDKVIYNKLGNLTNYFSGVFSCKFDFDENGLLSNIHPTKYEEEGKKVFIDECIKKYNLNPKDITFIGNGSNDEYVYLSGCRTICINPHKYTNYHNKEIWNELIKDTTSIKEILKYFNVKEDVR